jgi:hypothetical protein
MILRLVTQHVKDQNWFALALALVPMLRVGMHRVKFARSSNRSLMLETGNYSSQFDYFTTLEDMHSHAGAW